MNKTIVAIAAAVVLCLLGGPFATGLVAEGRLRERIDAMDANNLWLSAEVASYERGWFSSVATVLLTPVFADAVELPGIADMGPFVNLVTAPIPVRIDLMHGPVSIGESLHFGTAQVRAQPDASDATIRGATELLNVPYLFEFRGRAGFGGGFDFDADIPAFTYAGTLGETEFSGLAAEGFADRNGLTVGAAAGRLAFQSLFAAFALDGLAFEMTRDYREDRLPVSHSSGSIASGIATSPLLGAEPIFELENLTTQQDFDVDGSGETVGATISWSADLIAANGQSFESADFRIAARGIDAAAATAYYQAAGGLLSRSVDDPEQLFAEIEPILDTVVRRGFTITVAPADFSMEPGRFTSRVELRIDGSALAPDASTDLRDIAVLLNTLSMDADVTLARPLAVHLAALAARPQLQAAGLGNGQPLSPDELDAAAEAQAGLLLAALIGQGFVVEAGDDYTTSISFDKGELTINGETQPGLLPVF